MEHSLTVCNTFSPLTQKISDQYGRTCIHKFTSDSLLSSNSLNDSNAHGCAITALTQSPAIDVIGIGFTSGEISVYDVRADERLMRMFMDGGGVRALGFRSGVYIVPCGC